MKPVFQRARDALDFLEHHQLEPSAANYDLALRYISAPASELARDIYDRTSEGSRLTPAEILTLLERHCADGPATALDRREHLVARQAEELGTLTSDAHDLTEALGRDVGTIVKQSDDWPSGTGDLVARLSVAERDLAELRDEFLTLRNAIGVPGPQRVDVGHDELTRALNQTGARRVLEPLAQNGRSYVLMMFIIDDLIGINNRLGRPVGDNVLNAFAATLREVFPGVELIRWTGNEFVIVTSDLAMSAARLLAEDALAALRDRRLKLRGTGEWIGTVTASMGIVVSQGEAPEALLSRARANALSAAASGGDQIKG
ncbi:MAG: diguanylate cyclase [Sphingomonas sp.]